MEQSLKDVREALTNFLLTEVVTVNFTKTNGEERVMRCTLNPAYINDKYEKKTERTKKQNEEVMSVWDFDKQEWRSFRIDSVKSFNLVIE